MCKSQDAEEFYSSTQQALSDTLKKPHGLSELGPSNNLVDALFGIEMEQTLTCDESPEEQPIVTTDLSRKLVCNIQGGGGSLTQVDHLHEGVKLGLKGSIEKNSDLLGRNAMWTRTSRINRLPRYLCVQFMRFYWKEARVLEEGREVVKGQKCKIMRPVSFPEVLDVYDFCTPRIQDMLKENRDRHGDEILGDLKRPRLAAEEPASTDMEVDGNSSRAKSYRPDHPSFLSAEGGVSTEPAADEVKLFLFLSLVANLGIFSLIPNSRQL